MPTPPSRKHDDQLHDAPPGYEASARAHAGYDASDRRPATATGARVVHAAKLAHDERAHHELAAERRYRAENALTERERRERWPIG